MGIIVCHKTIQRTLFKFKELLEEANKEIVKMFGYCEKWMLRVFMTSYFFTLVCLVTKFEEPRKTIPQNTIAISAHLEIND